MGGLSTIGPPISETTSFPDGEYQAFANGVLYRPVRDPRADLVVGSTSGQVYPMSVGRIFASRMYRSPNIDHGDGAHSFWFANTQFGIHPLLWKFFLDHGGVFAFGYPISNLVWEYGSQVQWFQRARLEIREDSQISVTPLGWWLAEELRIPTRSVVMSPGSYAFDATVDADAMGMVEGRGIEIDVGNQMLLAFQGSRKIFQAPVSTGREATPTPTGRFRIIRRVQDERVVGGTPGTSSYYNLSNVYFTQYFTSVGHALHYAYWHDEFGREMSHGCVNLALADAEWVWQFGQTGVPVTIR